MLYRVNISTGTPTVVRSPVGDGTRTINGIGFNAADGYIYGAIGTGTSTNLLRISSSGSSVAFGSLSFTISGGDVDEKGYYWGTDTGSSWVQIDLRPGSTTYGQTISTGTATVAPDYPIYDWAYVVGGGDCLYAVAYNPGILGLLNASSFLLQFNRTTKAWKTIANYGNIVPRLLTSSTWGAVYASDDKALYASENGSGQIWKLPLGGTAATLVSTGPTSTTNDGARCINAKGL